MRHFPSRRATQVLARTVSLLLIGLAGILPPAEAGEPAKLLPAVPASANAIAVIDVESLLKTALADRHNWANKASLEYAERPVAVPAESSAVAIAASLDPQADLAIQWQVSVAQMTEKFAIDRIALWEGGYVDELAGSQAAWTPSNCYIVEFPNDQLAIVSPANRQLLSTWLDIRRSPSGSRSMSEYLQRAAQQVTSETQIVLAVDLKDAVSPHVIKERVSHSQSLYEAGVAQSAKWEELLRGIVGVTLKVRVSSRADGELRIDFSAPPPKDMLARKLVLEVLDNQNLHLDELEEWTINSDGNSLVLAGKFSPEGMRRVGSLLQLPTTKFSDLRDVEPAAADSPDYAQRSLMYYRGVCALIDDLNKTLKQNRDNHAVWMERYSQKVDALPILNVDDELLAWGATVGETFRTMALAQRASGLRQGVRKSSVYGSYYDYGSGYYVERNAANERAEIRQQEDAAAFQVRFESWSELENSRAEIRRVMTKKYGVEF
jgi:hypothetical protein